MKDRMGAFFARVGALMRKDAVRSRQHILPMLAFFLLICLGCGFLFLSVVTQAEEAEDVLTLGIVDKDGSFVSRVAIGMVTANEEVRKMFHVSRYDTEQEAYDAVYRGEAVGALIFEQGYFDKILDGDDSAVSVVLSKAVEAHAAQLREFAGTGEILIKMGEYGAGAAWQSILQATGNRDKALVRYNKLTLSFASEVMVLIGATVAVEEVPYSAHNVSLTGHYVLMYTVLLLSLLDILFFDFVRWDCSRTVLSRLRTMGVRAGHILASKAPRIFLIKSGLLALVLVVAGSVMKLNWSPVAVLGLGVFLVFNTGMSIYLCTLTQNSDVGPAILCGIYFAGLFLCGGLVPYDMMPLSVMRAGDFSTVGIGAALLAPVLGGKTSLLPFALAGVYLLSAGLFSLKKVDALAVKGGDRV